MTYIVSARAGDAFQGIIDNTQTSAEGAKQAALDWLREQDDKALNVLISSPGDADVICGWAGGKWGSIDASAIVPAPPPAPEADEPDEPDPDDANYDPDLDV